MLACATSPLGRSQLAFFPDQQLAEMGTAAFDQVKAKTKVSGDPRVNAYVKCVAGNITSVINPAQSQVRAWEVLVFTSDDVNAFALPGGKIGVYTGLLKVAKTQDQLAAVIGHEVAHVIAGHSNERYSEAKLAAFGGAAVQAYTGVDAQLLGMASNVFFLLPHSRTHEAEADIMGMDYMAKAGFDPRAAITLWQNMAQSGGDKPPEMLSTHPSDQTRIAGLTRRLQTAMPLYQQAQAQGKKPRC